MVFHLCAWKILDSCHRIAHDPPTWIPQKSIDILGVVALPVWSSFHRILDPPLEICPWTLRNVCLGRRLSNYWSIFTPFRQHRSRSAFWVYTLRVFMAYVMSDFVFFVSCSQDCRVICVGLVDCGDAWRVTTTDCAVTHNFHAKCTRICNFRETILGRRLSPLHWPYPLSIWKGNCI